MAKRSDKPPGQSESFVLGPTALLQDSRTPTTTAGGEPADAGDATVGDTQPTDQPTCVAPTRGRGVDPGAGDGGLPFEVTPEEAGRYGFEGEQGRGGQARVLIAFDSHVGRAVAWKELLPESAPPDGAGSGTIDPSALRFLREARVTAQLEHPGIVPVYEIGRRSDGRFYYTMRLVSGETLGDKLHACPTLADRLKLLGPCWDVCNAVAYAHDRGVIHRDLKPDNIMVAEFGETVVLDWGLAKVRGKEDTDGADLRGRAGRIGDTGRDASDSALGATMDGSTLGTPWYMSPEQAEGRLDAVDERSDVWGLGAVLYEVLTGRPPYGGRSAADVLRKARRGAVRPVLEACPEAPPELAGIAMKCLEFRSEHRYADASEVAADVSAYMTGGRVRAYSYSSWELLRRFAARNKAAIGGAAAVLAVIVAALVVVSFAWRREADARGRERDAHLSSEFHLAQAQVQQARRLLDERRMLSAGIYALGSLLHNPAEPRSLAPDGSFAGREVDGGRPRMEALSVAYRSRFRHVRRLERIVRAPDAVMDAAFSPDGRRVAAVDNGGSLVVWDASDGREVVNVRLLEGRATTVAFSPDGRHVAAAGPGQTLRIHPVLEPGPTAVLAGADDVAAVEYLPDGKRVVTGHGSGAIAVWDVESRTRVAELEPHAAGVWGIAVSRDGRRLASASWDKTARLWDAGTFAVLATLEGHTDSLCGASFSPDGARLATSSYDGSVRTWRVSDGRPLAAIEEAPTAVFSATFSPDGRFLLSGGMDGTLRLRDVESGALLMAADGHRDAITSVAFSPDGRRIASGSQDGTVWIWAAERDDGLVSMPHPDGAYAIDWSPDGRWIATASWDRAVRVWDARDGRLARTCTGHTDGAFSVAFSPDGRALASGGYDGAVRLWDARTGDLRRVLEGHEEPVPCVAFSPDGRMLATASHDRRPRIWNPDDGRTLATLPDHGGLVYGVAFSPDGRRLVTASFDHVVRVWNTATWTLERELIGHSDWVTDAVFSRDGRWVLTSGKDRASILWEVATWREVRRFLGHAQWVNRGTFSPDGRSVATGGDDGFLFLWDLRTGDPLLRVDLGRPVQGVVFSPDGGRIAVAEPRQAEIFPLELPDPGADLREALADAERAAGLTLDGFRLRTADGPEDLDH